MLHPGKWAFSSCFMLLRWSMEINDIPQDNSKIFRGQRKVVYATKDGNYQTATTNEVGKTEESGDRTSGGRTQPTDCQLHRCQTWWKVTALFLLYVLLSFRLHLAQATGFWQWQIKRHFKPSVFAKLSNKVLGIYAEAFGVSILELQQV